MLKKITIVVCILLLLPFVLAAGKITVVTTSNTPVSPGEEFFVEVTISPTEANNLPSFSDSKLFVVASDNGQYLEFLTRIPEGEQVYGPGKLSPKGTLWKSEESGLYITPAGKFYGWWVEGISPEKFTVDKNYVLAKFKGKVKSDIQVENNIEVLFKIVEPKSGSFLDYQGFDTVPLTVEKLQSLITIVPKPACVDNNQCKSGEKCVDGKCSGGNVGEPCTQLKPCQGELICKIDAGKTVGVCTDECTDNTQCNDPKKCIKPNGDASKPGKCDLGCNADTDCASPQVCNKVTNTCVDQPCGADGSCPAGLECDKTKSPPICLKQGDADGDGVPDDLDKCPGTPKLTKKTNAVMVVYPTSIQTHAGCQLGDLNIDGKINAPDFVAYSKALENYGSLTFDGPARIGLIRKGIEEGKKDNFEKGFGAPDFLAYSKTWADYEG